MMESGKHLDYLQKELVRLSTIYRRTKENTFKSYDDNLEAVGLLSIPEVSVANAHFKKGSVFPRHKHNTTEFMIVYKGSFILEYGEIEREMKVGSNWRIEKNVPHGIPIVKEDTSLIIITIPKDEEFPDAR